MCGGFISSQEASPTQYTLRIITGCHRIITSMTLSLFINLSQTEGSPQVVQLGTCLKTANLKSLMTKDNDEKTNILFEFNKKK